MLLLAAAIAESGGDAASPKPTGRCSTRWAEYLKQKGLDPENQLSTDDFMGHLAHNANLSLKAILALGAYAELCASRPAAGRGQAYRRAAGRIGHPVGETGGRRRPLPPGLRRAGHLEPEVQPGLGPRAGLDLFPPEIARKEIAY